MNGPEIGLAIVAIWAVAGVLRAKYGVGRSDRFGSARRRHGHRDDVEIDARSEADAAHREEVRQLKERIAVLERIVTDQNSSGVALEREIEALRNRD